MKKVAVVSDATSPEFFFPVWKNYYGALWGFENLHLVTFQGMKSKFETAGIANIWELNAPYDDQLRASVISDFVALLLRTYDVVVRCDIDELIIPDLSRFANLKDFVENNTLPYVTASGIDVIERLEDPPLNLNTKNLFSQRAFGIRGTFLNKTCVTTIPLRWAAGFHGASVFPRFSGLYNLHLKFADIKSRIRWHELMLGSVAKGGKEEKYFSDGAARLNGHQKWLSQLTVQAGEADASFEQTFLEAVRYNPASQIYQAEFTTEKFLRPLPKFLSSFEHGSSTGTAISGTKIELKPAEPIRKPSAPPPKPPGRTKPAKVENVVIDIRPMGNLGNRMFQYLAAYQLREILNGAEFGRVSLPEFGLSDGEIADTNNAKTLIIPPDTGLTLDFIASELASGRFNAVSVQDHMQRVNCLPQRELCNSIFPINLDSFTPGPGDLLINIRAAELVLGIPHYPLVPIEFYEKIINLTGLTPVFMGQIGENAYSHALRQRFPEARFIESQGVLEDFQTIRSAKNIIISVSTFSWLAAWLSDARQIFVPMLGFLNPVQWREKFIDLLPLDDSRYRFYKFPVHFGVPEAQALPRHSELTHLCRKFTAAQIASLRQTSKTAEVISPLEGFDEIWYANTYLDASLELSEGWFADAQQHYQAMGYRGYRAMPEGFSVSSSALDPGLIDHALGRPASQSSLSQWSVGKDKNEDAARAVMGIDQKPFAFHTAMEDTPWWMVDLGAVLTIRQIVITNRSETSVVSGRSTPITALISANGIDWTPLFTTPDSLIFGRNGKGLVWTAAQIAYGRFLRLTVFRRTFLHLRQVQVLGSAN